MITCPICNATGINFMELHLSDKHPEMSLADFEAAYPGSPVLSERAKTMVCDKSMEFSGNKRRVFSIEETFGTACFGKVSEVWGWEQRTEDVPELDPDYAFRRNVLGVVLYAIEGRNEPCFLTGPTGSGKTSCYEQVCARLNRPVTRINLDGDVTRSALVGQWIIGEDNKMSFHYGPLPKAMKEGHVLIVDEIDAGASPVMMVLQAVLEGKPLCLLETGEAIKPHDDFRLVATANTNGQGDESGLYHGVQPQNYALFDRFKLVEVVDYPSVAEEHQILERKTGMTDEEGNRGKLIEVAGLIRKAHVKGEILATMSTRNIVNIAQKLLAFGDVKTAYRVCYLNKLNAGDRDAVSELIQRVWG